jgi:hypothetical protein
MKRRIILTALALAITAGPALADDPLDALDKADCEGRSAVNNGVLVERLIIKSGLLYSQIRAVPANVTLGEMAISHANEPGWRNLFNNAVALTRVPYESASGYQVRIEPSAPEAGPLRARALLDGQSAWLTVSCPTQPEAGIPAAISTFNENLIVAGSLEDASKGAAGRDSATVAWTRDRNGNTDTADIDIFIGFPGWGVDLDQRYRPFVAFQKDTSKDEEVNDLTFGLLRSWDMPQWPIGTRLQLAGSYETDEEFDSEVWRVDAIARLNLDCGRRNSPRAGVMCLPTIRADYADIQDRGDKASLADLSSYGRLGAGFEVKAWYYPTPSLRLNFGAEYTFLNSLGDSDADAERTTFSASFSPAGAEWFSVGVEWNRGQDLTSLQDEDEVQIKVGFKH